MAISLRHLKPGDIFFAAADFGGHAICLMTNGSGGVIHARVITMQFALEFDPDTGRGNSLEENYTCQVTSIEPPPDDIQRILLDLDRRYQQGGSPALSKDEIHALTSLDARFDKSGLTL
jgi:hypothetical protein